MAQQPWNILPGRSNRWTGTMSKSRTRPARLMRRAISVGAHKVRGTFSSLGLRCKGISRPTFSKPVLQTAE